MVQGSNYKLNLQLNTASNTEITLWGTTSCSDLPFNGSVCPQGIGNWTLLGSKDVTSSGQWVTAEIDVSTTQDIHAIVLGGNCNHSSSYVQLDDLNLTSSIIQDINASGSYCANNLVLYSSSTIDSLEFEYQWFKDGIELTGENDTILDVSGNNYGPGEYIIMGIYRDACEVSNPIIIENNFITFQTQSFNTCSDKDSGRIEVRNITGQGITEPYEFFINGNGPFTDSTFYNLSGDTYEVVVSDSNSCTDTITETLIDYPNPSTGYTANNNCLGQITPFTDSSFINAPDNISSYSWFFDDGNISNQENPTHTYTNYGDYNVKLITVSNNGCKDSLTKEITIHPNPKAEFSINDDCLNIPAIFSDNSTIPIGNISYWSWSFGDNNMSSLQNPTHLYSNDGIFQVNLTVTSDFGCAHDTIISVTRHPVPEVNFSVEPDCFYNDIQFTNNTTINPPSFINNYIWDFGDGSAFSSTDNPTHLYQQHGSYTVSLIATSINGCVKDTAINLETYPKPVSNFTNTTVCEN